MRVSCIAYLSASPLVVAEDGRKERASHRERECVSDRQTNRERKREREGEREIDRQTDKINFYNKDSGTRSIWTASPLYTTNTVKHERTIC